MIVNWIKEVVAYESIRKRKKARITRCYQHQIMRVPGCVHPEIKHFNYATSGFILQYVFTILSEKIPEVILWQKTTAPEKGAKMYSVPF